jgi:carotenoid cleavage dioxygenase-like enzyme
MSLRAMPSPVLVQRHGADVSWPTRNKFLNGPFTPWAEESAGYDLEVVSGQIPADLNGALFRIASNPRFQPRDIERYHWWEGDGGVAGIYLRDGRAAFRMRWVETDSMKFEMVNGEAVYSGFVNGSPAGLLPEGAPPAKSVANTNVGIFGDHLLAYFEGGLPYALDPAGLGTLGTHDFYGGIDVLCTAHYKIDPATGDMLFFAALGPQVIWYRADVTTGQVVDKHVIETGLPVMIHDFTVSQHYAAFLITPTMLRFDLLAQGLPGVVWDEAALPHGSQVILMNRDTHQVTRHEIGGMFAPTHYYNAYEEGDDVVIDTHRIARLGNPADSAIPLSSHEWFPPAHPWQLRVNTGTGRVIQRPISGLAGEFARINDAYVGVRHRYGYFVTTRGLSDDIMTDGLAKHDYGKDATVVVDGPDFLTSPSEPTFVPRSSAQTEDDGYLLTLWWNRETGLSELLIHNAADLTRHPVARVKLPARVPFGFHGNWADAAVLDRAIAASAAARGEGSSQCACASQAAGHGDPR